MSWNIYKIKGIPIDMIIIGLIGLMMVIIGLTHEENLNNIWIIFGTISLLFALHLSNSHDIEKLKRDLYG